MNRRDEKAAATRRALIDATFDCLVELGYHGTSTVAVCARAGLARGTMLHHFPTKRALVLASIEDVLVRRAEEFRAELAIVDRTDVEAAVRQLWGAVRGPTFAAWLELAVASRTDPDLEREFRTVMARFDALVVRIVDAAVRGPIDREYLQKAVSLVFTALNGLALDLLQMSAERVEELVDLLARWVSSEVARSIEAGGRSPKRRVTRKR